MSLVQFNQLMAEAERGQYAVGYFESWNLESLLAVADAAQVTQSPVLLGFSGIYLSHPARVTKEPLSLYSALGLETCRRLAVPASLVFNESPDFESVLEAIKLQFGLVMFSDERLDFQELVGYVSRVVARAHSVSAAVEGELKTLPGVAGGLSSVPDDFRLTDPRRAQEFVERTGIDALAVNVGQAHLHGRSQVHLNLERVAELRQAVRVPLVLHGASSVYPEDLVEAIRLGVRKINVGSVLKRTYFEALRRACVQVNAAYNPYEVMGSGMQEDVLTIARVALQKKVEDLICLFGNAGRHPRISNTSETLKVKGAPMPED
jgi:ketose-bisphosphate aldolase